MADIIAQLFKVLVHVGLVPFLFLFVVAALAAVLYIFIKDLSKRVDNGLKRISILESDVRLCHEQRDKLEKKFQQTDYRLGQSLQREKVLSELIALRRE